MRDCLHRSDGRICDQCLAYQRGVIEGLLEAAKLAGWHDLDGGTCYDVMAALQDRAKTLAVALARAEERAA